MVVVLPFCFKIFVGGMVFREISFETLVLHSSMKQVRNQNIHLLICDPCWCPTANCITIPQAGICSKSVSDKVEKESGLCSGKH